MEHTIDCNTHDTEQEARVQLDKYMDCKEEERRLVEDCQGTVGVIAFVLCRVHRCWVECAT